MPLHIAALFTLDANSRLLQVNEPGGNTPAPRMFLGRTRDGNVWRFRAGLPDSLVEQLEMLCAGEPIDSALAVLPRRHDEYLRLLETHSPVRRIWSGPAYRFGEIPEPSLPLVALKAANVEVLQGGFEDLIDEIPTARPFFALVEGNRAVSVCRSVRITPKAHEAGVETLPEFRGQGYAKEAVRGWARAVRATGAIPLYSTSWENNASQAVVKKLNLAHYGVDFHIT